MNRDKQIEEMVKDLHSAYAINKLYTEDVAEYLYNADYRKAEDVAREIFEEIETSLMIASFKGSEVYYAIRAEDFHHYKKKYTEDGE